MKVRRGRKSLEHVRAAALDQSPVDGLTHKFYRYPARFSPTFVRAAIEAYSQPGDIVLDPFMGGGTTVIEAMALGRRAVGSDINSLAAFVSRTKVTCLSPREKQAILRWATKTVPALRCDEPMTRMKASVESVPMNMTLQSTRWLRKTIAQCIAQLESILTTSASKRFARCVLINVGQWALNGRRSIPTASAFRSQVTVTTMEMLDALDELRKSLERLRGRQYRPIIRENDAEHLDQDGRVCSHGLADLVVTSPPYPGIHMLYHRWQVDGRKETNAPYWIAGCDDGAGTAFYNFADRRRQCEDRYFLKAERSFTALRRVVENGAIVVQLIAFSEPDRQLSRYLSMMGRAGFTEIRQKFERRVWREVPGRRWYANLKGQTPSSREVVLLHRAS